MRGTDSLKSRCGDIFGIRTNARSRGPLGISHRYAFIQCIVLGIGRRTRVDHADRRTSQTRTARIRLVDCASGFESSRSADRAGNPVRDTLLYPLARQALASDLFSLSNNA